MGDVRTKDTKATLLDMEYVRKDDEYVTLAPIIGFYIKRKNGNKGANETLQYANEDVGR